jgi:hypothetical protein
VGLTWNVLMSLKKLENWAGTVDVKLDYWLDRVLCVGHDYIAVVDVKGMSEAYDQCGWAKSLLQIS